MRRLKWLLILLLVGGVALLVTFRDQVAMRLMERATLSAMMADPLDELPDGLHLGVCGAGAPLPASDRSGPCLAVLAGRRLFVVDAGTNGARNLQRMGLPVAGLEAVFLTHYHSDHIDGLGELAMLRWTGGGREQPLPVHGPTGVASVVEGFNLAYAQDAEYRTAHHGADVAPPSGAGSRAVVFEQPLTGSAITVLEDGGLKVQAFTVEHDPVEPAVGYRFDYGGRSLVISGDTRRSPEVTRMAEDVDLLVHEALSPRLVGVLNRSARRAGRDNLARITLDILDYHTTPAEAAGVAARARAGHLLLYHIVPPLPLPGLEAAFLEGVDDAYAGPVTVSVDGTFVSLPAGGDTLSVSNRL